MKLLAAAVAVLVVFPVVPLQAQEACNQPPVTTWTVQFFERWEDAVAKMVANAAFEQTMTLLPISSPTKKGYVVSFAKVIHYTTDCPPRPIQAIEENTPGWNRELLDSPMLAEAFAAALPAGTPLGITTLYSGYSAGSEPGTPGRRRSATHSSVAMPPRGVTVLWFDGR